MDITGTTSLARAAMQMTGAEIGQELSVAVTKQILNQNKQQAQALVDMVKQSNIVEDGHVDVYA